MSIETIPAWMKELEEEDLVFIKKFVLASGSLKEVAKQYQVTYPTVRLRLDRLIQKIQMGDEQECDPYISLIKRFALDGEIDRNTAQVLTREFKKRKEGSQT